MTVAEQLRALADQLDAQSGVLTALPAVAPNWVRVTPPFPKGDKYRDYPDPQFVSNGQGDRVETITGYASAAQNLWHCPWFDTNRQGGRLNLLGDADNKLLKEQGLAAAPRILDQLAFPNDYVEKVPADTGTWVSGGQPGFEDVPEG